MMFRKMACFPQVCHSIYSWSTTAGTNAGADASINWAEGQLPSTVNDSARAMMAALAAWLKDSGGGNTTGGTSTAYTLTNAQPMLVKTAALVAFKAHASNTGACTLNVDGLGASPLRSTTGVDLASGSIIIGNIYLVTWVSGSSEWLLINNTSLSAYLPLAGGTMTGALTLFGAPTVGLHAATKTYVDSAISGSAFPSGAVLPFAMNSAPTGWLAANGAAVSRTTYAALFTAISTTYGVGDGSTTFNLPDLRGYFVRGSGTNGDGTASGTFGAKQADAYLNHNHAITDAGHTHNVGNSSTLITIGAAGPITYPDGSASNLRVTQSATTGITVNTSTTGGTETRPKNIALLYCIKT